MYKSRHCIKSDYFYLDKISKEFLVVINRDNFSLDEVEKYLDTFSDFDSFISLKIRMNLEKMETDPSKYNNKIIDLIDELKQNVLVDIREHN